MTGFAILFRVAALDPEDKGVAITVDKDPAGCEVDGELGAKHNLKSVQDRSLEEEGLL